MQRGRLVAKLVVHVDNHPVADSSLDPWYGPLSINPNDRPVEKAIRIPGDPTNIEIVGTSFGVNHRKEGEYAAYVKKI
jgi:hypothetical protein